MLLRFAKIAGGLRLLVAEMAPIVAVSSATLTARTVAYLVGFALGSIGISLWPIVVTLVSIAGIFGGTTAECDAYRAELERIRLANEAIRLAAAPSVLAWQNAYKSWSEAKSAYMASMPRCLQYGNIYVPGFCDYHINGNRGCSLPFTYYGCIQYPPPYPVQPPVYPTITYLTYRGCTPPNCPISRKVWVQVIWASPSEFGSHSKGCFLVAYSFDKVEGVKIQYNPFNLSESFLRDRAKSPDSVAGNRFTDLDTTDWKDFESSKGWDRGYWAAEDTDPECRGWRPGWTMKVK
jgi:hypothetical protein